jgi:hypothetical protein
VTLVAGVPEIVGATFGTAATVIANEGSDAVARPSFTLMTMPDVVPTFAVDGVPLNRPVDVLNVAQVGMPWMLNVSGSLSASVAVGWNAYAWPAVTLLAGVPVMVGAVLGGALTVIANEGNDVVALPSLTRMTMPDVVPTFAVVGVPLKRPVVVLNEAHAGLLWMLNVSGSLFASLAAGWNEYA